MNSIGQILEKIVSPKSDGRLVTFLNPYSYLAHKRAQTRLDRFDVIYVDGILLVMILKIFGMRVERRSFDFTSLAADVLGELSRSRESIFIIGGAPGEASKFTDVLRSVWPGLNVVGIESGYVADDEQRKKILADVVRTGAQHVLVGMGAPRQEQFILALVDMGWAGNAYTCGAFITQTATRGRTFYPRLVDRLHLRWAYRIWDDPRYMKRYFIDYPIAVLSIIIQLARVK